VITNAAAGLSNVKAPTYVDAAAPAPGETNGQLSGANSILNTDTPAQLFFTTSYPKAPVGASEQVPRLFPEGAFKGDTLSESENRTWLYLETTGIYEMVRNYIKNSDDGRHPYIIL
jgi:hypothetical protein